MSFIDLIFQANWIFYWTIDQTQCSKLLERSLSINFATQLSIACLTLLLCAFFIEIAAFLLSFCTGLSGVNFYSNESSICSDQKQGYHTAAPKTLSSRNLRYKIPFPILNSDSVTFIDKVLNSPIHILLCAEWFQSSQNCLRNSIQFISFYFFVSSIN